MEQNIIQAETPTQKFCRLAEKAKKFIISKPGTSDKVDILETDKYLIVYSHRKGSHWNIFGSHWYYYHDKETGEFTRTGGDREPDKHTIIAKSKFLLADYKRLEKILIRNHAEQQIKENS